jgi:protein gp37
VGGVSDHGTAIEWTQAPGYKGETWNPVTGCDRVSPGCAHCYALDLAARLKGMGQERYQKDGDPKTSGPGFGLTLHPDKLEQPLRWRKPRMVFVNSMSDLFHEEIPDDYIRDVLEVIEGSPQHIFQVLTKRPERMRAFLNEQLQCEGCLDTGWHGGEVGVGEGCPDCNWAEFPITHEDEGGFRWQGVDEHAARNARAGKRYPNLWLGVSIENRRFVHRADVLRGTPAAVRFISAEPLLGPLVHDGYVDDDVSGGYSLWSDHYRGPQLDLTDIDWLIVGGESGPQHRRLDGDWVRDLRSACAFSGPACRRCGGDGGGPEWPERLCAECNGNARRGVAFFFKQWGGRTPKAGGRELDGRTWDEFPAVALSAITEAA